MYSMHHGLVLSYGIYKLIPSGILSCLEKTRKYKDTKVNKCIKCIEVANLNK